jgi:hypothetical protein
MAWLPRIHLGVIADARRRQRQRRLVLATGAVAAVIAFAFALDRPSGDRPASPARHVDVVAPSRVLSREPYMGVACSVPNSTRCDRIGLAVWLKRPAVAVRAEIGGRHFAVVRQEWRTQPPFAGFLRHAGLKRTYHVPARWLGAKPPVHPVVRLLIDYGRGRIVETRLRVWLAAGWG